MFVFDVVSWRAVVYCMVAAVACCTAVLVLRFWCCDLVLRLADKSLIGCNLVLRLVLRLVLQLWCCDWCCNWCCGFGAGCCGWLLNLFSDLLNLFSSDLNIDVELKALETVDTVESLEFFVGFLNISRLCCSAVP